MSNDISKLMNSQIEMRIEPATGKTYYLYERNDKSRFLSILSPKEWEGERFYKQFLASVRMSTDGAWESASE